MINNKHGIHNFIKYQQKRDIADIPSKNAKGVIPVFNNYTVYYWATQGPVYLLNEIDPEKIYKLGDGLVYPEWVLSPNWDIVIKKSKEGIIGGPIFWNDVFMCAGYPKYKPNKAIILRRFPLPVLDNFMSPRGRLNVPIGQMITFFTDEENKLSDILSFTTGFNWRELEADVWEANMVNRKDPFAELMSNLTESLPGVHGLVRSGSRALYFTITKMKMITYPDYQQRTLDAISGIGKARQEWLRSAWREGPYWNRIQGPVNVIHKAYRRDRGVTFKHTINLKFKYQLRSVNGISPKALFLDLLGNILLTTYTSAKFWGGALRYFPNWDNLTGAPLGGMKAMQKLYNYDIKSYFETVKKDIFGTIADTIDLFKADSFDALFRMVSNSIKSIVARTVHKFNPQFMVAKSLLSGDPVGEWHITIGNPFNPIAMIGNLILKETKYEFGNTIGFEDFPIDFEIETTLEHGRPRDKGEIESMFNYGQGQLYFGQVVTSSQFDDPNAFVKSVDQLQRGEKVVTPEESADLDKTYLRQDTAGMQAVMNVVEQRLGKIYTDPQTSEFITTFIKTETRF